MTRLVGDRAWSRKATGLARVFVAVVVAVFTATACASQARPDAAPTTTEHMPGPGAAITLHDAEQSLIGGCMRERGFEYRMTAAPPVSADTIFPYGINDESWAQKNGFGSGENSASRPSGADDPNAAYIEGLASDRRAGYLAALDGGAGESAVTVTLPNAAGRIGQSAAGCTADAQRRLYGDFEAWFRSRTVAGFLVSLIRGEVVRHSAYRHSTEAWARCMLRDGHRVQSVHEARRAFAATDHGFLNPAATRAAVSEARCVGATRLTAVADDIDRQLCLDLPSQYRAELATYERLWRAALIRVPASMPRG